MNEAGRDTVAIIGSGGIGGYLAGALVEAGHAVTMCVRTPFETLTIESGGRTRTVPVTVATDPATVSPARWVLLTTKSQDTESAGPWLRALAGPGTILAIVQNGIGHVERARPIAGPAAILPAIIYCSVERTAPGRMVHHGAAKIVVPAGPEGSALSALLAGSEFTVDENGDFVTAAWRKLLNNLVGNALTAITLRRTAMFAEPEVKALAAAILAEAVAVAQAEGAALTQAEADSALAGLGRLGPDASTSMLYDRLAGRPLEHRYLTGALVEAADRHGIPVPVNRTLLALLGAVSGQRLDRVG